MKDKSKPEGASFSMTMIHQNAAAIDIGATLHMAAVGPDRSSEPVRSFGTFTADLHRLADWFGECGVKTVAMELTSVYWIPIFELLDERGFEVFLVNARDAKHVPGRKTDVSDAQWLQRLHTCGLLRASFRPNGEIVELRAYYAMHDATHAALFATDLETQDAIIKTHHRLIAEFGKKIVLGGLIDATLGRALNRVQDIRLLADYDAEQPSREDAQWAVEQA